jgi:catechol 2,3-dioxygenase-like lactoylglutathione lyase family enzyme
MAYRFLLEVPGNLVEDASIAVERTGDAQVVVVRTSHGLGYDDSMVDLTVAAHSLRVIDSLYGWFDSLGASRPDIRLVLHGGDRLALEATDRGGMVAAIRRDQPWVERSLPRIGDHVIEDFAGARRVSTATPASGGATSAVATVERLEIGAAGRREIIVRAVNHVAIRVLDLAKAERFYTEFFGMELAGRSRRGPGGTLVPLNGDYRWEEAQASGTEADVSTLRNGPLTLAVQRVGQGVRLDSDSVLDHVSVAVDATTFATIKGEVLMRGFPTLAAAATSIAFRDPFGLTWEVTTGR